MTDERGTFESTRARLEEILAQVRKKDTSLEQSLELLEEGVRLANTCNELIDQTSWRQGDGAEGEDAEGEGEAAAGSVDDGAAVAADADEAAQEAVAADDGDDPAEAGTGSFGAAPEAETYPDDERA